MTEESMLSISVSEESVRALREAVGSTLVLFPEHARTAEVAIKALECLASGCHVPGVEVRDCVFGSPVEGAPHHD